ncbi:MAG: cbb3-type cytochrome oxidase assembly protein [Myxococcales bacterium]|nr:cbb3-type cytochrome oxidase assembly protein [Myxococcales bacterium]
MEVLFLLVFVSLMLVVGAIGFFAWNIRGRNHEHGDRLCLLPLEEDDAAPTLSPRDGT